jgi:hypothetical protein
MEYSVVASLKLHPHPSPPLEGEGILRQLKMVHGHIEK